MSDSKKMAASPFEAHSQSSVGGLAALMLRRRPGSELWLFFVCQALAVAIVTGILLFTNKIQNAIYLESAKMMAADTIVESYRQPPKVWSQQAEMLGLRQVKSARLMSMLFFGDNLQLTDIRVVSAGYPLRGDLTASVTLGGEPVLQNALADGLPAKGEVWLDEKSALSLGVHLGEQVEVGERLLRFSKVLIEEPGASLPSLGLSGRALMRLADLKSTKLVLPGSRVNYRWMLAGAQAELDEMASWLGPKLSVHERIQTQTEGNDSTATILTKAASFLSLGGAIAVLLAGIAAMIAAARYMSGQQDSVAIMRALGATRQQLLVSYLSQFAGFSLLALLAGYVVGFSLQALGFYLIKELFDVPAIFELDAFVAGAVTAMFCLLCFALPTLTALVKISPMRLLRSISSSSRQGRGVLWFALGFLALMYYYSGDWRSTVIVYGGIVVLAALVWSLSAWLQSLLLKIVNRFLSRTSDSTSGKIGNDATKNSSPLAKVPEREAPTFFMPIMLGIKAFCRQPQMSRLRTAALAMTIALVAVIMSLRGALLDEWQAQLPVDAPNYFALNISPDDVDSFTADLQQPGFRYQHLYAVARARLVAVNSLGFADWGITDPAAIASLGREMMLAQAAELPSGNEILLGQWHGGSSVNRQVSVEQGIAERFKLSVGDLLHFSFAGTEVVAELSSIRQLNWNTMQPNFYFILSPPYLKEFPYTYMTSFFVPTESSQRVDDISRRYPSLSLIDIGLMVERAKGILSRVSLAIESVAWVTVMAGLLVVIASLRATLDTRLQEQTIARALGGSARVLRRIMLVEFVVTGLIAGIAGILAAQIIVFALGEWVFLMPLHLSAFIAWILPLMAMLVVVVTGFTALRQVHTQSPLAIWRGG